MAHWTQVSDRCPLGYLFFYSFYVQNKFVDSLTAFLLMSSHASCLNCKRLTLYRRLQVKYKSSITNVWHLIYRRLYAFFFFTNFIFCEQTDVWKRQTHVNVLHAVKITKQTTIAKVLKCAHNGHNATKRLID